MIGRPAAQGSIKSRWQLLGCLSSGLFLFVLLLCQPGGAVIVVSSPVFHPSLKAASEAAAADQSLVLLVFSAEWCGPCKLLKAKTLSSKEFAEGAGALHVAEIDVDTEAGLAGDYNVTAVPTLVLMTSDNKIVARSEGFQATAELLTWLREARERAKQGKWEGTAPGSKVAEFAAKAATDQLGTNDLARLIGMLGESNPADREAAAGLLLDQRELAVIPLIEAVTNAYLGVRISASEALHKLAPEAVAVDPWQTPAELAETESALRKWWEKTGKLPAQASVPAQNQAGTASILSALDNLRGTDPVRRTEAMSMLVAQGTTALPSVREAIKRAEKTSDQRTLTLLEDVLWAILIPDEIDQRAGGVRSILARGKGPERQAAATRLGNAGRGAIPALAQLANDADPLVVESSVRALSSIGGKDVIPATAALLKAEDSNLRMTAAQALGHTKNAAAIPELLTVLNDSNEVVVCAALSALVEIKGESDYSPSKTPQPPEVIQALKPCLTDPRWRVRAAAAEVTGKLAAKDLVSELTKLLGDADGFVVKSALEALQKLGATPEVEKLLAVARNYPGLREETVEIMVKSGTDETVKGITALYESVPTDGRVAILRSLGAGQGGGQEADPWQPLLAQAITNSDPRLRRVAAESLATRPPKIAAALIIPLLSDEDQETRASAAGVVLNIVSGERQVVATAHGTRISEFVTADDYEDISGLPRKGTSKTNEPPVTSAQLAAWHSALQQKAGPQPDLLTAAAIYVTGSSNADLPALEHALENCDKSGMSALTHSAAVAAILPRLPWPEGQGVVTQLCGTPALFLAMAPQVHKAGPGLRDYLLDPPRFRAAVEAASPNELESSFPQLLGSQQKGWSLLSTLPPTEAVVHELLNATNAAWRAAAIYALGLRDDPKRQSYLEQALADSNGWVRVAAVSGLTRAIKDRPARERLLTPLLTDPDKKVARLAMTGLLEPETRTAAELDYANSFFEFDKIHVWSMSYEPNREERPLATLPGTPAFLEVVRVNLTNSSPEDAAIPALLLAQYGDFTGLEYILKIPGTEDQKHRELDNETLTAIGLSKDSKYLPYLKKIAVSAKDESDFRRLLQAMKGMTGAEAREMRLEINKRMRQGRE